MEWRGGTFGPDELIIRPTGIKYTLDGDAKEWNKDEYRLFLFLCAEAIIRPVKTRLLFWKDQIPVMDLPAEARWDNKEMSLVAEAPSISFNEPTWIRWDEDEIWWQGNLIRRRHKPFECECVYLSIKRVFRLNLDLSSPPTAPYIGPYKENLSGGTMEEAEQ